MKKNKNEKITFWLIGLGTGVILSGMAALVCTLNMKEYKTMLVSQTETVASTPEEDKHSRKEELAASDAEKNSVLETPKPSAENAVSASHEKTDLNNTPSSDVTDEKKQTTSKESSLNDKTHSKTSASSASDYKKQPETSNAPSKEPVQSETKMKQEKQDVQQISSSNGEVTVIIPIGYNAEQVSRFLEQHEIIDDAVSFKKYIASQGKTKNLGYGAMTLPKNGDYQEILDIIAVK